MANVTYQIYGKTVALLDNAVINTKVSAATKAGNTTVKLSEPKEYATADLGYTFYHSSGVVMFEDSWPSSSRVDGKKYDSDFNDCIIDYDVEAVVVPDALLASEGWREQVKAVIHVRVTGAQAPWRVGMILEGFDQQYVESISDYKTLDSWQNPHGELPNWTVGTLQENSLHYESNPLRPCIEIGGLQRLNDANRGAGTEEYTRIDDKGTTHKTVFNPRINKYWTSPKTEQYDAALADITTPATLAYIQSQTFYNAIPGYVNVDGGLYTYTVIYHMKPRAEMSAEESAKALKNMIDAVNVTTNQNFYIVNNDFSPVGLKGYQPVDFAVKEKPNGYKPRYDQVFAANTDKLDATIPYCLGLQEPDAHQACLEQDVFQRRISVLRVLGRFERFPEPGLEHQRGEQSLPHLLVVETPVSRKFFLRFLHGRRQRREGKPGAHRRLPFLQKVRR